MRWGAKNPSHATVPLRALASSLLVPQPTSILLFLIPYLPSPPASYPPPPRLGSSHRYLSLGALVPSFYPSYYCDCSHYYVCFFIVKRGTIDLPINAADINDDPSAWSEQLRKVKI